MQLSSEIEKRFPLIVKYRSKPFPYLPTISPLTAYRHHALKLHIMYIRVDRSEENFPKSILTMVFGCQNASG